MPGHVADLSLETELAGRGAGPPGQVEADNAFPAGGPLRRSLPGLHSQHGAAAINPHRERLKGRTAVDGQGPDPARQAGLRRAGGRSHAV